MSKAQKFRVHTLVTDGQITRKILTVQYTGEHFIFIYPVLGEDHHDTYHKDGVVLDRISPGGPVFRKQQYSPLDDFKGNAVAFGAYFNLAHYTAWGVVPSQKKANADVIIDLRKCLGKTKFVSVNAPLLVPGDLEPLEYYRKNCNVLVCEVFKETVPWFAIVGYYTVER